MIIYEFIEKCIDSYSSSDLPDDMKDICKRLNEILNNPPPSEKYLNWLMKKENDDEIVILVSKLFKIMQKRLFLNLEVLFRLLRAYQYKKKIKSKRDHYHHSIQCFLLGLSLYHFLCQKTNFNDSYFLLKIFSICFYHDLGYLYHFPEEFGNGGEENVSIAVLDLFFDYVNDVVKHDSIRSVLCLDKKISDNEIDSIYSPNEQNTIWRNDFNTFEKKELERQCSFIIKGQNNNHAFESAIMLLRISELKSKFYDNNVGLSQKTIKIISECRDMEYNNTDFLDILKAIVCHNYKIDGFVNWQDNFWICFLMLIDEMQTYGRPFKDSTYNYKLINPLYVGFDVTSGKIKMEITSNGKSYLSALLQNIKDEAQEEFNKHSCNAVRNELKEKVDVNSLDLVLEP